MLNLLNEPLISNLFFSILPKRAPEVVKSGIPTTYPILPIAELG